MRSVMLKALIGASVFCMAGQANAGVTIEAASLQQGTLVHGNGVLQVATTVTGNLGAGGPNIVNFNGDTTETAALVDNLRLQQGQGQADITGAEITVGGPANDLYNLLSGDIFLTGHAGMDWIEFGLTGLGNGGTVDFIITLSDATTVSFLDQLLGNGDTFWGFLANGGTSITNVHYSADDPPGELTILKQVRINETVATAVPEPGTWAMMLLGFGAAGFALRRRKRRFMGSMQIA